MKFQKIALHAAVVAGIAGIASSQAIAGPASVSVVTTPLTYGAQSVTAAGNVVGVPINTVQYRAFAGMNVGATLTFNLPSGMTFQTMPTVTASVGGTAAFSAASGLGTGSIQVTVNAALGAGEDVRLGAFSIGGASQLANTAVPVNLNITAQVRNGAPNQNDGSPVGGGTGGAATNLNAVNGIIFNANSSNVVVNVRDPSNGTKFLVNTVDQNNVSLGDATIEPATAGVGGQSVLRADGTGVYTFPAGSATSLTVSGNFPSIATSFLKAPSTGVCPATPPSGAISGTVSPTELTYTGLVPGTRYDVCLVTDGTGLIAENGGSGTPVPAASGGVSNLAGAVSRPLGRIAYNGTVQTFNYVVGDGGGYGMFVNVANLTAAPQRIQAVVRMADGEVFTGPLTTALTANGSELFSMEQIVEATSAPLTDETQRANLTLMSIGNFAASKMILNPSADISETVW
jgi:hypothetical protein